MRLNEIYETYKNEVAFFLIYIREAHPSDGWQTPQNLYDEVIYTAPGNDDERAVIASECQIKQDIRLPMLLDGIDNAIEDHYVAAPIRLFVVDRYGVVQLQRRSPDLGDLTPKLGAWRSRISSRQLQLERNQQPEDANSGDA